MSSNHITDWTTLHGSLFDNQSNDIVIGSDGYIYITGTTRGDLNGQSNSGLDDAFISKFNNAGEVQWTRLLGTSKNEIGESITIASDGSLYVVGYTNGDLDGETNASSSWSDTLNDVFISKFNSNGVKQWTKLLGVDSSSNDDVGIDIADDDSIYITGNTLGNLDGEENNGSYDAFISKYNSDGNKQWNKLLGSSEYEFGRELSIGSNGSFYLTGYTTGDLNGETNFGEEDAFISAFNSNGERQWTKVLGTSEEDKGKAITISNEGFIYLLGETKGDLDGQTNNGSSGSDVFISRYDSSGTKQWTKLLGTSSSDMSGSLLTGSDGSIYIFGTALQDLNGEENNGSWDSFISKYKSDGEIQWTKLIGSSSDDRGRGITIDNNDSIYLTGYTEGDLNGQSNNGSKDIFLVKLIEAFTPTDISLSASQFNENIDAASTVATLSTADADASDTHTYELVIGDGDTDNDSFSIEGSYLKINSSPDYETKSSYSVRLKTLDSGGLSYEEAITFSVNDLNEVATDISSTSTSFNESINAASTVATLSTADSDESDTHTYELVRGDGDTDNSEFTIEDNKLKINSSPDYETKSSYSVRLKTLDSGGLSYEEAITFSVNDLIDETPTDISLSLLEFEWTRLLGTLNEDNGQALATGSDGSIYIAGSTSGDLDGNINNGLNDAFISKFNNQGEREWTRLLGTPSDDYGQALATGSDGSIYIAGVTEGDLDGQTISGARDSFISKYSPDGTNQWTKIIESSLNDLGKRLTTGLDGSIYIIGLTEGDLDGQSNSSEKSAFISKYNPDGTEDWTQLFEGIHTSLTTGLDGSIYSTGEGVSKYNPDGAEDWTQLFEGIPNAGGEALATGSDGSIYIIGTADGNSDAVMDSDAFLSKYNPDGTKEWSKLFGEGYIDEGRSLAIGSDGGIYILYEQLAPSSYWRVPVITKVSVNGNKQWTKIIDGPDLFTPINYQDVYAYDLITGIDGSIYIAGHTMRNFQDQINNGNLDHFISKLVDNNNISIDENTVAESVVAFLLTTDQDSEDFHTYELVSGDGDTDNSLFSIDSNELKINSSPDYEIQSSYSIRLKTTDSSGLSLEESLILDVNDLLETDTTTTDSTTEDSTSTDTTSTDIVSSPITDGIEIAKVNTDYTPHKKGFASISAPAPITVTAYEVGTETTLDSIKDYDGNLHAGDNLTETSTSYKYQGMLDVNGDGIFEAIFTNKVSKRWVTAKVDSTTGQIDFNDNGAGGGTRVVGIYEDPLIAEGSNNGGFLSDGVTPAPANFGVSEEERYVEANGETIDRLALNSQVRFQNDLDIDNLSAKHSGDYDSDGVSEVYWKTNDGTAYLRALMHDDGNIRYANYQSEDQMSSYLTSQGHTEIISDIV